MSVDLSHILAQLAQDEGRGWGGLIYLVILVILPIINAIKDKYVKHIEEKKKEGSPPQPAPGLRRVEPKLPMAKALPPTGRSSRSPRPTPVPNLRPVQSSPPVDRDVPVAIPIPPAVQGPRPPTSPSQAPRPKRPAKPSPEERSRVAKLAHARMIERHSVGGVQVSELVPDVDVHMADPTVNVSDASLSVDLSEHRIRINLHELIDVAVPDLVPRGRKLAMGRLTAARMREAIILNEVLGRPVGLRDPMNPASRWV